MCKDTSLYIERAQLCDSQIDCPDGSDECDDSCDQNVLNNPKRILGAVALLVVVWILGMITITKLHRPRSSFTTLYLNPSAYSRSLSLKDYNQLHVPPGYRTFSLVTTNISPGIFSLCLNCLLIISMSRSAFIVLREAPHRFIYRSLVTTIAIGKLPLEINRQPFFINLQNAVLCAWIPRLYRQ